MRFQAIADSIFDASKLGQAFARGGHRATLLLHEHAEATLEHNEALILDADVHGLSKLESRARLQRLARGLRTSSLAFYKFDSSLRRPWDDLFATLEASGRRQVVLAAFAPLEGFEVRHGTVFWHGAPLHRTSLARDRHNPVYEAHLPTLLEREGLGAVELVRDITPQTLERALSRAKFVVVDGGNRGDAEALIESVPNPEHVLWAGGYHLARALGAHFSSDDEVISSAPQGTAPTLVALERTGNAVLEQLLALKTEGVTPIALSAMELIEDPSASITSATEHARAALQHGNNCALHLEFPRHALHAQTRVSGAQLPHLCAQALAQTIAQLSSEQRFENLLLSGSQLAQTALRQLGAQGLTLEPNADAPRLLATRAHRVSLRSSSDAPQTLLGAYQVLAMP
jgi:uncharacterized protein YgbK (DUF1537 family)